MKKKDVRVIFHYCYPKETLKTEFNVCLGESITANEDWWIREFKIISRYKIECWLEQC